MTEFKVPFVRLDAEGQEMLTAGLSEDLERVIASGTYLFGPNMERLEARLSDMFHGLHVVTVGSGTDALAISLRAVGVREHDVVAVPSLSAIPSAVAVKIIGGRPVYVDVGDTGCMDAIKLEECFKKYPVKAVMPVHMYGNLADMDRIVRICRDYGTPIIEDCAHSFGAGDNRIRGTAGAFSFYPTKNLGSMGDAGAIVTHDPMLAKTARELRFYGQRSRKEMGVLSGLNSRMDEFQACVLLRKLDLFERFGGRRRREIAEAYDRFIPPYKHEDGPLLCQLPRRPGWMPHLYPVLARSAEKREPLRERLAELGIQTLVHYPFHLGEAVENSPGMGWGSVGKDISEREISLPCHPWMGDEEIEVVENALKILFEEDK